MKKINHKILSIPPYISTAWKNIHTLHVKEKDGTAMLVIALHNGTTIEIPNLDQTVMEKIFEMHGKYVEEETKSPQAESLKSYKPAKDKEKEISFSFGLPLSFDGGEGSFNPSAFLEHNPSQSDAPEIPKEVLDKVMAMTKALGLDLKQMNLPKGEPHCHCPYCQIARVLRGESSPSSAEFEEEISDEDLKFRDWDIEQKGDKLYFVSNPLNTEEHYQVYLGSPIGCTCGKKTANILGLY